MIGTLPDTCWMRWVRRFIRSLALAVAALAAFACAPQPVARPHRPNLVLVLADDLGFADLGAYGSRFYETPHIDRLAQAGVRFTQAYTAGSVCSPTRASIVTGKYPVRTGITDFIPGMPAAGLPLVTPGSRTALALDELTLGEALQAGGYQTFYAGKWHLGGAGFTPHEQGFEVWIDDQTLGRAVDDWRVSERLTDAALRFLDERDRERPFFMMLGYHEPHIPILSYPNHVDHFRAKAAAVVSTGPHERAERDARTRLVQDDPAYASEVAGLDDEVGRLCAGLERDGIAQDTVVVFLSDNGGLSTLAAEAGPTANAPLRAGKGWLYEGGIRVPLIVRGPGIGPAGAVSDVPLISNDLYPTLLDLAGLPLRPEQHRDGVSFAALLWGGAPPAPRPFFWHYPHYHGSGWAPGGAVRDGRWKLIELFAEARVELYDLETDPGETRDLAASDPEEVESLRAELAAWRRELGAAMPTPRAATH